MYLSTTEASLEDLNKNDLIALLRGKEQNCVTLENERKNMQAVVTRLEAALSEKSKKCQHLEEERSFLRSNIRKASAHWFERKAKLSESESEQVTAEEISEENEEEERKRVKTKEGLNSFITEETINLFSELKFKNKQLEVSERQIADLTKRTKDYEKLIDDQEIVIHGLEHQLNNYFNDNQKMSKQLADLHKLFKEIESINDKQVKNPEPMEPSDNSKEYLPTEQDFKEMKGSVSKTYIKLKELIYEKKSLVTEIERLQTLNVELQHRVSQQENRLVNVSDALQTTWLLVSNLKDEHAKLHTSKSILRYELKEKREILQNLREELECSREQWHTIRQKNYETEQAWTDLKEELNERRKLVESKGEHPLTVDEIEGAIGGVKPKEEEFEPPIDLLVDLGIEYGVVDADDEEPTTAVALIGGEDVDEDRLQNLEEQCCHLYQKLMSSTARALNLASRLSSLHEHYSNGEDEDDDDSDDNNNDEYLEDEDEENLYETEIMSPDSESYDTAYVSEADGADSNSGAHTDDLPSPTLINSTNPLSIDDTTSDEQGSDITDDTGDALSRRLITFLPRKIEILKAENKKLEERLSQQQEEKVRTSSLKVFYYFKAYLTSLDSVSYDF